MAVQITVPEVGESITEVQIGEWLKDEGDYVQIDEDLIAIETDKASMAIPAPASGVLTKILKPAGEIVEVGTVLGKIQEGQAVAGTTAHEQSSAPQQPKAEPERESAVTVMPAAERLLSEQGLRPHDVAGSGRRGAILKEDVIRHLEAQRAEAVPEEPCGLVPSPTATASAAPEREEETVPMSLLRRRVAERLVAAQQTAALLTTFNEIDMTAVMELRGQYRDTFQQTHDVKLGFMSFFVKAAVDALKRFPAVNAEIRGTDIVYKNYYDIGIAVGGGKGLVVPIVRNAERLGFAAIEQTIGDLARRAQENKLSLEELEGGTFTISNGGIYGSLLSTPIVNPPQSGILGMHAIQDRPVAVDKQVVIRPMMYVALTYDHRIVDGREAVGFLLRIKECIEDPTRMLLEV